MNVARGWPLLSEGAEDAPRRERNFADLHPKRVGNRRRDGRRGGDDGWLGDAARANVVGRGIGAVLLTCTLQAMRARGYHCAWFLWTDDRAAKLYRQHGFEEARRFALMRIPLNPDRDVSP